MKLGKAFSDSVFTESKPVSHVGRETATRWWHGAGRALLFSTSLVLALFLLAIRMFQLTVIDGHHLRTLADENRTRELIRHAPRGIIYDRTGKPLVTNIPQFRLLSPCPTNKETLCTTHIDKESGEAMQKAGLPAGSFLEIDYSREYPLDDAAAHVVGYMGAISDAELKDDYYSLRGYRREDEVGRAGAEALFEEKLRGRDGRELVEVDANGKIIRTLGVDRERAGVDVTLSLDARLTIAARDAFPKGERGAIVVTKPQTGEVLAMYSSPSYSANSFSRGMTPSDYQDLLEDPDRPMFNRAIGGVYPPGSTFKIITGMAALEEGALTKSTTIEDTGVITIGPFSFGNWYFLKYGKTEGLVNIIRAYQRSNDIFFYKTGERVGITKLAAWAKKLGIGAPLGIELGGEAGGLMPDPAWKANYFTSQADLEARNNLWYLGDTYHVAIGQGYLLTTPLQVNAWTNVIANGGKLCKPTIENQKSIRRLADKNQKCTDLGIKKETIDIIRQGMTLACVPGGTGWPLFNFQINKSDQSDQLNQLNASSSAHIQQIHIPVACKTGTAEFGEPLNKTHAWFTAFAPLPAPDSGFTRNVLDSGNEAIKQDQKVLTGEPEISVTVLVEGAGEGSDVAGPIAKKIFEEWFSR